MLPFISFAGDAFLSLLHFTKRWRSPGHAGEPEGVASGISIDLSIQFLLVWLPLLVLVAWATHKPLLLLFDLLEVALLVAACFLVNFVTADAKTNWAEGAAMVFFYFMVVRRSEARACVLSPARRGSCRGSTPGRSRCACSWGARAWDSRCWTDRRWTVEWFLGKRASGFWDSCCSA